MRLINFSMSGVKGHMLLLFGPLNQDSQTLVHLLVMKKGQSIYVFMVKGHLLHILSSCVFAT